MYDNLGIYIHANCQSFYIQHNIAKINKNLNIINMKVEASAIPSYTESNVLSNPLLFCFLITWRGVYLFVFLLITGFKNKPMLFWQINNAHEIPWTTLQGFRLHIEEMRNCFYNACFKIKCTVDMFSSRQTHFC